MRQRGAIGSVGGYDARVDGDRSPNDKEAACLVDSVEVFDAEVSAVGDVQLIDERRRLRLMGALGRGVGRQRDLDRYAGQQIRADV